MTADRRPLPDELDALKEIIGGRPADPDTMQRLVACNLVEEFDGTALLTTRGIEAAALLSRPDRFAKPRGESLPILRRATTPTVLA
jgi:hypothetical protein